MRRMVIVPYILLLLVAGAIKVELEGDAEEQLHDGKQLAQRGGCWRMWVNGCVRANKAAGGKHGEEDYDRL